VRICAKMRCGVEPAVTVSLVYAERVVVIGDLVDPPDPGRLDLCRRHAEAMTPPVGWTIRDARAPGAA
jgi:hypothetical protein